MRRSVRIQAALLSLFLCVIIIPSGLFIAKSAYAQSTHSWAAAWLVAVHDYVDFEHAPWNFVIFLEQNGNQVKEKYPVWGDQYGGQWRFELQGVAQGNELEGTFSLDEMGDWDFGAPFTFTMSDDGLSFRGTIDVPQKSLFNGIWVGKLSESYKETIQVSYVLGYDLPTNYQIPVPLHVTFTLDDPDLKGIVSATFVEESLVGLCNLFGEQGRGPPCVFDNTSDNKVKDFPGEGVQKADYDFLILRTSSETGWSKSSLPISIKFKAVLEVMSKSSGKVERTVEFTVTVEALYSIYVVRHTEYAGSCSGYWKE